MTKMVHPTDLIKRKVNNEKITMLTAYDMLTAQLVESAGVDCILVGDSVANVYAGFENTLPISMDQMIYHTQSVSRGVKNALVIGDMPFMSYQVSESDAKYNAGRFVKEGMAHAVKIETTPAILPYVKAIIEIGIPVLGHLGFTPQWLYQFGGYKVQGRSQKDEQMILNTAKQLEEIGCFGVVLEMVPEKLAKQITDSINIPTIGIGAGRYCDGQVLVTQDLLGLLERSPKFAKQYAALRHTSIDAIRAFRNDVEKGAFPQSEHSF